MKNSLFKSTLLGFALSACNTSKPSLVEKPELEVVDTSNLTQIDQNVSNVKSDVDYVFSDQYEPSERDLYGISSEYISAGRAKFVRWRNMKLRTTFNSLKYNERPVIGSYEYKIMSDFIFNYAEQIQLHFSNLNSLDFDFVTNDSKRYFKFSTHEHSLFVNVIEDSLIKTGPVSDAKDVKPYNISFSLTINETGEEIVELIDFNKGLSGKVSMVFMKMFKQMIDIPSFATSFSFFSKSDELTSASIPFYNNEVKSVGYYSSNRVFMDTVCEMLKPYPHESDQLSLIDNTPSAHMDVYTCFTLADPQSDYAKQFGTVFDELNGNFPVMFAIKLPNGHIADFAEVDAFMLPVNNVSVHNTSCSLNHLTIDNVYAYLIRNLNSVTTPWSFDVKSNGNMRTNRVNWLKFNGEIISPTLVTLGNFNNGRVNNVPIVTFSDVAPSVCRLK